MAKENNQVTPRDFRAGRERFLAEVISGLRKPQKELPSKYFYDERGSALFQQICPLNEYYIPRTEESIMQTYIDEITELIGPQALLIEYGSGDCRKIRFLLDHLHDPVAFIPVDISHELLENVGKQLDAEYPDLEVLPICADYTTSFELAHPRRKYSRPVVFFPGSTISNFDPVPAKHFLEHIASVCAPDGALLIGVDLKKDTGILHSAYNDSQGITAAFNLNLLNRINRELNSDFQLDSFQHYAFFNPRESRVEMHLVSRKKQSVTIDSVVINFEAGESIWTESSYKYTSDEFRQMASSTGFHVEHAWTDRQNWFSVQYLVTI
jgi:dimethylhistidine N-methyltransferase